MTFNLLDLEMNIADEMEKTSLKTMNQPESEEMLKDKKPGCYFFRIDAAGILFLSGIGAEGEFHHVKIEKKESFWKGMNGGNYQAERLKQLVCLCLNCEEIYGLPNNES
jgi:hypothetical protein